MISDGVASTVTRILEENIQYGTGVGANYGQPAAGKTGRPKSGPTRGSAATRPGSERPSGWATRRAKIPMTSVHGIRVTGGSFPAQIWRLFMSSAIGKLEPESFPEPKDLPEWKDFERGQYARSFGYYNSGSNDVAPTTPTTTETAPADTVPDAPPASRPTPKPKPKPKPAPSAAGHGCAADCTAADDGAARRRRPSPSRARWAAPRSSRRLRSLCSSWAVSRARGSRALRSSRRTRAAPAAAGSESSSSALLAAAFASISSRSRFCAEAGRALRAVLLAARS